jgi:hypothetical protein
MTYIFKNYHLAATWGRVQRDKKRKIYFRAIIGSQMRDNGGLDQSGSETVP